MSVAYVDSSVLVAIAFQEEGSASLKDWLNGYAGLACSGLVEAEVRSACHRERITVDSEFFSNIDWVVPVRPLSPEIASALATGYLKGADLWHVATALYYAHEPREVTFLTLDVRQRDVAAALGFRVTRDAT